MTKMDQSLIKLRNEIAKNHSTARYDREANEWMILHDSFTEGFNACHSLLSAKLSETGKMNYQSLCELANAQEALKEIIKALAMHHKERFNEPDLYSAVFEIAKKALERKDG